MQEDVKIITLCGSTRFKEDFMRVAEELTLQGNIVFNLGIFTHSKYDSELEDVIIDDDTIKMLQRMHRIKIDMSDAIFVINKNKYIGESTKSEIEYAKENNKQIIYMENF